jgi:hypothetical protein
MLSEDQIAYVEHLLATAAELPPGFPLMSAGEFLKRMAAVAAPVNHPDIRLQHRDTEVPIEVRNKQSQSQRRRWAEHNAISEQRAAQFLAAQGPQKIVALALGINIGVPRAYRLVETLKLERLADGRYRLPLEAERLAS